MIAQQLTLDTPLEEQGVGMVAITVTAPAVETRVLSNRLGVGGKLATVTDGRGRPLASCTDKAQLRKLVAPGLVSILPAIVATMTREMAEFTPCPPRYWRWTAHPMSNLEVVGHWYGEEV